MQNYFKLFSLDNSFALDKTELATKYQELILAFHPDKFINNSSEKKLQALQKAAIINSAYKILLDDLSRATHLLALSDIEVFDEADTKMDSVFLARQIELREELEIINDNEDLLEQFVERITIFIKDHTDKITAEFAVGKNPLKIKQLVRQMRFYQQLKKQTNAVLDDLL